MEPEVVYKIHNSQDMMKTLEKANEAAKRLSNEFQDYRDLKRRNLRRTVVYLCLFLMMVGLWFLPIKTGYKVFLDLCLAFSAFWIWAMENTIEMDHDAHMSPDEMIMQKRMEERSAAR